MSPRTPEASPKTQGHMSLKELLCHDTPTTHRCRAVKAACSAPSGKVSSTSMDYPTCNARDALCGPLIAASACGF